MKARIQARAKEMGVEKSANTAEVISKAAESASRNRGTSGELNLSVFNKKDEDIGEDLPKYLRVMKEKDSGRELSAAEKLAADPFAEMNILSAMLEEVKLVEWPSLGQVARQTAVTSVALVGTPPPFLRTASDGPLNPNPFPSPPPLPSVPQRPSSRP